MYLNFGSFSVSPKGRIYPLPPDIQLNGQIYYVEDQLVNSISIYFYISFIIYHIWFSWKKYNFDPVYFSESEMI